MVKSELANQAVQLIDQLGNELQEIESNIAPDGSPDDIVLIRERLARWKDRAVSNISEHINPDEYEGLKFYFVHLPYTFFCPECGLEQNHAFICADCGMLIPAECGENDDCGKGFYLRELKWGKSVDSNG